MEQPTLYGRLASLGILMRGDGHPELLVHIETTLDAMQLPHTEWCKAALHQTFKDFADNCNADLRIVKDSAALVDENPPGEHPALNEEK